MDGCRTGELVGETAVGDAQRPALPDTRAVVALLHERAKVADWRWSVVEPAMTVKEPSCSLTAGSTPADVVSRSSTRCVQRRGKLADLQVEGRHVGRRRHLTRRAERAG